MHNVNIEIYFYSRHFLYKYFHFCFPVSRRIVRGQTPASLQSNDPELCADRFEDWGKNETNCAVPAFAGNPPMVSS